MHRQSLSAALAAAFLLASPALAHDWYEPQCCSGHDCEELPDGAVTHIKDGYRVRYVAKLGLNVDVVVPRNKARPSQDGKFHGCANPMQFLCLYVPMNV